MTFSQFSEYLQTMEQLSSRLEMTDVLAALFKELGTDEIKPATYLMQGSLVPPYQSMEFQLSSKMVIRALAKLPKEEEKSHETINLFGETDSSGDEQAVNKKFKQLGDLGLVAQELTAAAGRNEDRLRLLEVYEKLVEIACFSGSGSQSQKVEGLAALLKQLSPLGAKFVTRIVIGKLRLGFSTMTILDALSWAATGGKSHRDLLELAYQKRADAGELAQFYLSNRSNLQNGSSAEKLLAEYTVEVGIPVVPALCQRLNTAGEIIEKMGCVIAEPKYDGLRIQIHFLRHPAENQQAITAYTRNLEDISHMFPELQEIGESLNCDSCILDAEVIGFNPETGKLLPFQQTITRKRKHGISEAVTKVPVRFYIFDVIKVDHRPLIAEPLRSRKTTLREVLHHSEIFVYTPTLETCDPVELHNFHEELLKDGLEGAVIKKVDGDYQGGRKGWKWVKIKETEGASGKLSDTLDLIVLGYYSGRGKRVALGIGAFLVGTLVKEGNDVEIKTVAKIGTGLTDDQFREMKLRIDNLAAEKKPKQYDVPKGLIPDVWAEPELVVEIAADEVTQSPLHTAKVALRFPRLVKFREDKTWDQATTVEEIKSLK